MENSMTITTMLLIAIPNIILGFILLLIFAKVYRKTIAMHEATAEYIKKLTETCIDVIKKIEEDYR